MDLVLDPTDMHMLCTMHVTIGGENCTQMEMFANTFRSPLVLHPIPCMNNRRTQQPTTVLPTTSSTTASSQLRPACKRKPSARPSLRTVPPVGKSDVRRSPTLVWIGCPVGCIGSVARSRRRVSRLRLSVWGGSKSVRVAWMFVCCGVRLVWRLFLQRRYLVFGRISQVIPSPNN